MLYDVKVLNHYGVWCTDLVTSDKHRATERQKYLTGFVPAVKTEDQRGQIVKMEGL